VPYRHAGAVDKAGARDVQTRGRCGAENEGAAHERTAEFADTGRTREVTRFQSMRGQDRVGRFRAH